MNDKDNRGVENIKKKKKQFEKGSWAPTEES